MKYKQNDRIMQVTDETLVVGVDIAKKTHYARAFDWRGIELDITISFKANSSRFKEFSEWAEPSKFYSKNTGITVNVPVNASLGTKNLSFNAFNSNGSSVESFNVLINVQNDLWSVNISDLSRTAKAGIPAEYSLVLSNESIGEQKIELSSSLPSYWMQKKTFDLDPKSVLRDKIEVNPKHYGKREFSFVFSSLYSSESKKFNSRMTVESSLSSKYSSPSYGFPFFTPSLFPYFLAESFLSLLAQPFLLSQ